MEGSSSLIFFTPRHDATWRDAHIDAKYWNMQCQSLSAKRWAGHRFAFIHLMSADVSRAATILPPDAYLISMPYQIHAPCCCARLPYAGITGFDAVALPVHDDDCAINDWRHEMQRAGRAHAYGFPVSCAYRRDRGLTLDASHRDAFSVIAQHARHGAHYEAALARTAWDGERR